MANRRPFAMSFARLFRRWRLPYYWRVLIITIGICVMYYILFYSYDPEAYATKFRRKRFEQYQRSEEGRNGPGEKGQGVYLSGEEKEKADSLMEKEAFNIIASDKISLERSVKDVRDGSCALIKYPQVLPTASVVIIFHNEAWAPLLRTAHSVVNRSPPEYLHEVILLDDFSDRDGLGKELSDYVADNWPDGVVKIVRTTERSGLIRARLAGARAVTGDVLIFLDSHCEAGPGWLEPLLARIKEDRKTVVCPMIDFIDKYTLEYNSSGSHTVGGFWWNMLFSWHPIPLVQIDKRRPLVAPTRSPTMAGGLFAADRKYFFEIGAYDEGMDVWGGENLEISFRIWMCGGKLELIPCSRVGHIFRSSHPYTFPGNTDTNGINTKRLAEVWLDEYKRLFYTSRRDLVDKDPGDLTSRKDLRKRLKCHSFKWYLDNVYPEKFIPDENIHAWGMVRNTVSNFCLDTMNHDEKTVFDIQLYSCQGGASVNQIFSLSLLNELRREEGCLSTEGNNGDTVQLIRCYPYNKRQQWKHDKTTGSITHTMSGRCLDVVDEKVANGIPVKVTDCNGGHSQTWTFEHYIT